MQKLGADQGLDGEFLLLAEKTEKWFALCLFKFPFIAQLVEVAFPHHQYCSSEAALNIMTVNCIIGPSVHPSVCAIHQHLK